MIPLGRASLLGFLVLLLVLSVPAARGQEDVGRSPVLDDHSSDPLDGARERARARFTLAARTATEVRREWYEACRDGLRQEFERIGEQITADDLTLQQGVALFLAADQAREGGAAREAERRHWELERRCDTITERKFRGGNTKQANHLYLRALSLAAALRLRQSGPDGGPRPWLWDEAGPPDDPLDQERHRAQALRAALEADPAALRRQRFDAAQQCLSLELQRVGEQITADDPVLVQRAELLAEAARALRGAASPAPVLDVLVELAWQSAEITEAKFRAGNTALANVLQTRYLLVKAVLDRRRARDADTDEGVPLVSPVGPPPADPHGDLEQARSRARARHDLEGIDRQALAIERQRLARAGHAQAVERQLVGGPSVSGWSRWLWEAEVALASDRASLLAAHLAYWERELAAERETYARFLGGNRKPSDYLAARGRRLQAELAYIELRDQKPRP